MRSSMRFLICFGSGLKCRISCVDASSTSFWWSSDFLVFMMRTMAASMACLRSSSTVARVESFSSCVILAAIIGTLMRRARSVKPALYEKTSSCDTSAPAGSLLRILTLPLAPPASEIMYRLSSSMGRLRCCWISLNVYESCELKRRRTQAWYVETMRSCVLGLPPGRKLPTTVAEPSECTQRSWRCEWRWSKKALNVVMHCSISRGRLSSSDLYVGQKPVVNTCSVRSVSSLISFSLTYSLKADWISEDRFMSVTMPSSLEVNCAPQRSLSLAIIERSASSDEERASSSRLASCFL
mmetsp:Transcript_19398/g.41008  ORF Transcript_19398/g.41008 Transcript_19398/m.41008 type:complete len:297 (-) Transcript_19398:1525-2415(-)